MPKRGEQWMLLRMAWKKLHPEAHQNPKKIVVFQEVAQKLGRKVPTEKKQRFDMLAFFVGFPHRYPPANKVVQQEVPFAWRKEFLTSFEWRRLRMEVIKERGARCECCGSTPKDGVRINVDHVKPRKRYPELALEKSNLQVLCEVCNHGKGNWDETDWRSAQGGEK